MNYLTSKMRGLSAVLAVIGSMGMVSTADAKLSTKVWDPEYGVDLENLGWSGKVTFNIDDGCLASVAGQSGWIDNFLSGANCAGKLSIKSATVTLYDLVGTASDVTLSYGSGIFAGGNLPLTLRMYVDADGSVKAVQGGFLFPEFVNASSASFAVAANYDAAAYWLSFNGNKDNNFGPGSYSDPPEDGYAFLSSCSYKNGSNPRLSEDYDSYRKSHLDVACSQNDGNAHPAILRDVPEPKAYLLGLASFAVLGVWSRRRRGNAG